MKPDDIDFGPIWTMSGTLNFFGQGFPFHRTYRKIFRKGFAFDGITFVAKTTTLNPRAGNMPTKNSDRMTPRDWRPACIIFGWWQWLWGVMLNAVGLTGPGIRTLLSHGLWQQRTEPFMISFMAITNTLSSRMGELELFLKLLAMELPNFRAPIGLQINVSCPNVKAGKKSDDSILEEVFGYLALAARYLPRVPIVFKINTLLHPETAVKLSEHPQCYGVCVSNTLPWSAMKWWQKALYFPSSIFTWKSPLHRFGGGGLSGRPLLPLVEQWVREARLAGFRKHINAGGGILRADDVTRLKNADSVSIGSVAALRPWRLRDIRDKAYEVFQ